MSLLVTIHALKNGQLIERLEFDVDKRRVIKIGNASGADVRLDEPSASRLHAVIEINAGVVLARDLGTTSGTVINGLRVDRVQLGPYNEIVIGSTVLQVAVQPQEQRPAGDLGSLNGLIASLAPQQLDQLAHIVEAARRDRVPAAAHAGGGLHAEAAAAVAEQHIEIHEDELEIEVEEVPRPRRRTWQPPVPPGEEKYNTLRLATQMRRDKQRGNAVALLAVAGMLVLMALPLIADQEPRTEIEAALRAAAVEAEALPPLAALAVPEPEPEPEPVTYIVQPGDTLGDIARTQLGDPSLWPKLQEANAGLDPSRLEVGARLIIP